MEFTVGETEEPEENEGIQIPAQIEEALQQPQVQSQVLQVAQEQGIPPVLLKAFLPGSDFNAEDMQKAFAQSTNQNQNPQPQAEEPKPGIPENERGITPESNLDEEKPPMPEATETTDETEEKTTFNDLNAEDIQEGINGLIEYFDEDMTLGELQEFIENNPDIINNALDLIDI